MASIKSVSRWILLHLAERLENDTINQIIQEVDALVDNVQPDSERQGLTHSLIRKLGDTRLTVRAGTKSVSGLSFAGWEPTLAVHLQSDVWEIDDTSISIKIPATIIAQKARQIERKELRAGALFDADGFPDFRIKNMEAVGELSKFAFEPDGREYHWRSTRQAMRKLGRSDHYEEGKCP